VNENYKNRSEKHYLKIKEITCFMQENRFSMQQTLFQGSSLAADTSSWV